MWTGKLAGTQLEAAPKDAARKMRTARQFDDGGGAGNSKKNTTLRFNPKVVMGGFDFKDRSGVGGGGGEGGERLQTLEEDLEGFDLKEEDEPQIGNSGLNAALLEMHNKMMEEEKR